MEDVRSSETLEKEVLEDARKKAERILKNAEKQIESLEKEWKEKKEAELASLNAEAEAKKNLRKKEMDAAFPLEIQRRKLKFMDNLFGQFLSDFFEKLHPEDFACVLEEKGKRFAAFLNAQNASQSPARGLTITYAGISFEIAKRITVSLLGGDAPLPVEGKDFHGLVFTGAEGAYRYRLTVDEIAGELREYHRQPIMAALWKERN
jgi:vacuolar-type H+-ATPase subunit E/Vma4